MSTITETNWSDLLPSAVSARVIESAIQQSVVLRLATRQPMPTGTETVPVVAVAPSADFVAVGGRKPVTRVEWSSEVLRAEEIAAMVPVPEVYVTDTRGSWDVEASVENEMAKAIGKRLDRAVLWGDGATASYPSGGIAGLAGAAVTGADALEAIDAALTALEGEGLVPDGIASSSAIGSALRAAYREAGAMPGESPASQIYGVPVAVTSPWPSSAPDALVGGWENLLIGVREDVTFSVSREGTLFDENGDLVTSAWQDDMVLCRIYARFGVAVARPLAADGSGPAKPFVAARWTGGGNGGVESAQARGATPSSGTTERRGQGRPRRETS